VVDDDKAVCREIAETLRSVGHDCICVGTQEEAEAALGTQEFCYVLLDLQLPVSLKSIRPRLEIGFSLLAKIRERSQARDLWVVVMTAYGSEHFECLRAMKMGANDYLKKPFPESGSESLEAKVREAARACNRAHGQPPLERTAATPKLGRAEARSREPQPFVGGEMVFYLNRVELCGVRILGDSGLGHSRRMLDLLRQRRNDGRYVRMGGEDIAARIGAETGAAITIGTVTGCARTLRANFTERLRQHLNIMCDDL